MNRLRSACSALLMLIPLVSPLAIAAEVAPGDRVAQALARHGLDRKPPMMPPTAEDIATCVLMQIESGAHAALTTPDGIVIPARTAADQLEWYTGTRLPESARQAVMDFFERRGVEREAVIRRYCALAEDPRVTDTEFAEHAIAVQQQSASDLIDYQTLKTLIPTDTTNALYERESEISEALVARPDPAAYAALTRELADLLRRNHAMTCQGSSENMIGKPE